MKCHLLLFVCLSRTKLVHLIIGALCPQSLNAVRNGEFVDRENGILCMWTEFEGDGEYDRIGTDLMVILGVYKGQSWMRFYPLLPKDIAVLETKEHYCLGDLLMRHAYGDLNAWILAIISNREILGDLVAKFALPFHSMPNTGKDREEHEALAVLGDYGFDYQVLAKYTHILSSASIEVLSSEIINVRHSFLPLSVPIPTSRPTNAE